MWNASPDVHFWIERRLMNPRSAPLRRKKPNGRRGPVSTPRSLQDKRRNCGSLSPSEISRCGPSKTCPSGRRLLPNGTAAISHRTLSCHDLASMPSAKWGRFQTCDQASYSLPTLVRPGGKWIQVETSLVPGIPSGLQSTAVASKTTGLRAPAGTGCHRRRTPR
jgi:hypothetical protein